MGIVYILIREKTEWNLGEKKNRNENFSGHYIVISDRLLATNETKARECLQTLLIVSLSK